MNDTIISVPQLLPPPPPLVKNIFTVIFKLRGNGSILSYALYVMFIMHVISLRGSLLTLAVAIQSPLSCQAALTVIHIN